MDPQSCGCVPQIGINRFLHIDIRRGSPFVYYGEEIGMNSAGTKDENKRIPMVWSKTDNTGMTDGPADMDQGIESPFEGVDVQEQDEDSILK